MLYPLIQSFVSTILATQKSLVGPVLELLKARLNQPRACSRCLPDIIPTGSRPQGAGHSRLCTFRVVKTVPVPRVIRLVFRACSLAAFRQGGQGNTHRAARRAYLRIDGTEQTGRGVRVPAGNGFCRRTLGVAICYFVSLKFLDPASNNTQGPHRILPALHPCPVIPAFIGVIFLFFVKETHPHAGDAKEITRGPNLDSENMTAASGMFFLPSAFFTLGNSSNQFLLLRSMDLGFALVGRDLMYFVFNLSSALLSNFSEAVRYGWQAENPACRIRAVFARVWLFRACHKGTFFPLMAFLVFVRDLLRNDRRR